MKIVHVETLLSAGKFPHTPDWAETRQSLHRAVQHVDWPPGSGSFTIYPQSGKKRGEGNGVVPIKLGLVRELVQLGWRSEVALEIAVTKRPGKIDVVLETPLGHIAVEWETGNISSSHRAINKMALGLLKGVLVAGVLVVPSASLAKYLTDRIGNWPELTPYLDLWKSVPIASGVLEIVVIEHDATSFAVPRIPKGTDGRAAR